MTTTADTPLQRALQAWAHDWCETRSHNVGEATRSGMRAALVAALQVKWDEEYEPIAEIGSLRVGWINAAVLPQRPEAPCGAHTTSGKVGNYSTIVAAKSAVERAVIEAILGESL